MSAHSPHGAVRLIQHPVFGQCGVAARPFQAGEVVFAEAPLMVSVPEERIPSSVKELCQRHGIEAKGIGMLMAHSKAPKQVQQLLYSPAAARRDIEATTSLLKAPIQYRCCMIAKCWAEAVKAGLCTSLRSCGLGSGSAAGGVVVGNGAGSEPRQQQQEDEHGVAMQVALIWDINAWSYDGDTCKASALFHYGSKLTHTCAPPNVKYCSGLKQVSPELQGSACFLALRDIAAGDLLTVSYLMPNQLSWSTPARWL